MPGGDICDAYRVELSDESVVFVKTRAGAPSEMFATEAMGLRWLAETNTLRTPKVLAHSSLFLALEFLQSAAPCSNFDEVLGRGLALLHQYPAERAGWSQDNFIGPLPQPNEEMDSWIEFFIEQRLQPRLAEAVSGGRASKSLQRKMESLFHKLPTLVPNEPLSRLHGDLWGGNLHIGPKGEPCLIDPAVYVGHREVDLAMMRLFGGFSPRVFESYQQAYPLLDGHQERVALYQLYPLMVHVVLFGGGYAGSVERILDHFV